MKQQPIPSFEGRKPDVAETSFSGKPSNEPTRPHQIGEDLTLVVRAHVKTVKHDSAAGGALKRVESLVVDAAFEMDEREGNDLVERLHTEYAEATGENVLQLTTAEDDDEFGVDGEYEGEEGDGDE